jgi:GTP-binding protein
VPRGGPDGGDGGRGGSVILRASPEVTDLAAYRGRTRWNAEPGGDGAGGRKSGRGGKDLVLEVPVGTVVLDPEGALIADLDQAQAQDVVAAGGRGGRGNVHFKSSTRHTPDYAEPGLAGEEATLTLDLKLIADIGLVGPPNAGKSSLLAALTAARPKVADYPFTTLDPALGVAETPEGRMVVADIPGLIEGASTGAGLGLRFLRHVERTKALVFLIDGSGDDPWVDLEQVRAEVEKYSPDLVQRPHVIAVNKLDLAATRKLKARTRKRDVLFVSALTGEGLPELAAAMMAAQLQAPPPVLPESRRKVVLPPAARAALRIERKPWGFAVAGTRLERLVERTDLDSAGSLERFQVELDRQGVNAALEAAGVKPGDTVRIGKVEFEYQP